MKKIALLLAAFLIVDPLEGVDGASLSVTVHEQQAAIEKASQFLQAFFIERDSAKAYELTSDSFKSQTTPEMFDEFVESAHKTDQPSELKITHVHSFQHNEYIAIYAESVKYEPQTYYRISLEGTHLQGYLVGGFRRQVGEPIAPVRLEKEVLVNAESRYE